MKKKYYACGFRLNQTDRYLIWILDEPDAVWVDKKLRIPVFKTETALSKYAKSVNITVENEEPGLHNLDMVAEWIERFNNAISCQDCLVAWNLFSDVAHSYNRIFSGDIKNPLRNKIYDKLFFGNNLYGLTPGGDFYIPEWNQIERNKLAEILAEGLFLFSSLTIGAQ